MAIIYRPLLFASLDPEVARAKGLPIALLSGIFLIILAVTVTEAAQVVGTLLVLSLAITPAAAAHRLTAKPFTLTALSIIFALVSGVGGLLLSLAFDDIKPTVFITGISFFIYLAAYLATLKRA
jgi:zinc/manganese transport system permease protein